LKTDTIKFNFENLEIWKISLGISDLVYKIVDEFPQIENYNLKSQILRASTSVCLNIAEGSTLTSKAEKKRYIRIAIGSLLEIIACIRIIERRKYILDNEQLNSFLNLCNKQFAKLNAFIKSIN